MGSERITTAEGETIIVTADGALHLETAVLVAAIVDYGVDMGRIRQAVAVMTVRKLATVADSEAESVADTFVAWQSLVESLSVAL